MADEEVIVGEAYDQPTDISDLLVETAYVGKVPYATIIEKITMQFEDYINIEDTTNYVDIFYSQLENSYSIIAADETNHYAEEIRNILMSIHDDFIDELLILFEDILTITIPDADVDIVNRDKMRLVIQALYEYFILNARDNFKIVIGRLLEGKLPQADTSDYLSQVETLMEPYFAIFRDIDALQFIRLTGNKIIYDMFNENEFVGNFLRQYSPRLYQNEIYMVEIIDYLTIMDYQNQGRASK